MVKLLHRLARVDHRAVQFHLADFAQQHIGEEGTQHPVHSGSAGINQELCLIRCRPKIGIQIPCQNILPIAKQPQQLRIGQHAGVNQIDQQLHHRLLGLGSDNIVERRRDQFNQSILADLSVGKNLSQTAGIYSKGQNAFFIVGIGIKIVVHLNTAFIRK